MYKAKCYYCKEPKSWSINIKNRHGFFVKHINLCDKHMFDKLGEVIQWIDNP